MRHLLRRYRGVFIIAALLAVSVSYLYVNAQQGGGHSKLVGIAHWITGPIQSTVNRVWSAVAAAADSYLFVLEAKEERDRLRTQLDELKREVQGQEEQIRENERLHRLLKLVKRTPDARWISARVIGVGQSPSYRSIRIDRGVADGIDRRSGVVTADGVVGRVVATSSHYADVLLIVDGGSRLDIVAATSRAHGVLRGAGGQDLCHIDAMDRTYALVEGDALLTSGLDGVFPKGVPVGSVVAVDHPTMGLYLEAEVAPLVRFSRLEEVMVLVSPPETLRWPPVLQGETASGSVVHAGLLASELDALPDPKVQEMPASQPASRPVRLRGASPSRAHRVPAPPAVDRRPGALDTKPQGRPGDQPAEKLEPVEQPPGRPAPRPIRQPAERVPQPVPRDSEALPEPEQEGIAPTRTNPHPAVEESNPAVEASP